MKKTYSVFNREDWPLGVAFGVETEEEFFRPTWMETAAIIAIGALLILAFWQADKAINAWLDYQIASASYEISNN